MGQVGFELSNSDFATNFEISTLDSPKAELYWTYSKEDGAVTTVEEGPHSATNVK
jgi:hypothetical protein